jgi:hypothetical protein
LALLGALSMLALACEDPVLREHEQSLGPDTGGYPEGPYHRAGTPCTWCHAEGGSASPHFDLAGTVYSRAGSQQALAGVNVHVFDESGRQATLQSNEAGNFFLGNGDLELDFPLWVKLEYQGEVTAMQTPIRRERSCAACHLDPAGASSAGHVYLWEKE